MRRVDLPTFDGPAMATIIGGGSTGVLSTIGAWIFLSDKFAALKDNNIYKINRIKIKNLAIANLALFADLKVKALRLLVLSSVPFLAATFCFLVIFPPVL